MRRRVARVLRASMFFVGAIVAIVLLLSFPFRAVIESPPSTVFSIDDGLFYMGRYYTAPPVSTVRASVHRTPSDFDLRTFTILAWGYEPTMAVAWLNIPICPVAVLCLAWPVTSFIIARRRRKGRGFEVETKAESAVSTADS